jgi:hypothetical protein
MRRNLTRVLLSLCIFAAAALAADDPFLGTWKANVAKSAFSPGPPPTSVTVTIEPNGTNGIKVTVEAINAKGEKTVAHYSANYDGKEYPFVQTGAGAVSGQTVSLKRIDSHTVERTTYVEGKQLMTEQWVVSQDGKTRTVTQTGTNAQGQAVHNVVVNDKQ